MESFLQTINNLLGLTVFVSGLALSLIGALSCGTDTLALISICSFILYIGTSITLDKLKKNKTMEWETKLELAKALNDGDNETVCNIILNNDMDIQAWDMFFTGMDINKYEDYKPVLPKIKLEKDKIAEHLKLREFIRMNTLIVKLERNNEEDNV